MTWIEWVYMISLIQRHHRPSKLQRRDTDDDTEENSTTEQQIMASSVSFTEFPQFQELSDDLRRLILSFLAEAPFEHRTAGPVSIYRPGSLTSQLPFVCRDFKTFADSDECWYPALRRQLSTKAVWRDGLRRLAPPSDDLDAVLGVNSHIDLLGLVQRHLSDAHQSKCSYKQIYQKIVTQHIQFTGPVFAMPCHLTLGEIYGLHLFEPRYRLMVRDLLMEHCANPEEAARGGKIQPRVVNGMSQPPLLLHACQPSRLREGELACLVQLVWCRTYEYGTADVRLLPVCWVRVERLWVRHSSGHLIYAKVSRIDE